VAKWRECAVFLSALSLRMEYLLPVSWVNYGIAFPAQAHIKGSRANKLATLLAVAAPDPIDAIGILLRFSNKNIQVSQRISRQGYPCHIFAYSQDSWNSMNEWLADLIKRKNCYSSGSILAQRLVEGTKTVMVPPGTTAEEAAKKIAEASATPTAPNTVVPEAVATEKTPAAPAEATITAEVHVPVKPVA
jgi:hypothetical protein